MPQGGAGAEPTVAALARAAMAHGIGALADLSPDSRAAPNTISPLRWLERAHRLVPLDPNATLSLASACFADDPARAEALFAGIAGKHDIRQAWLGLAAARLRLTGPDDAAAPLAVVLSRYAFTADTVDLIDAIGCRRGSPGWCALRPDGRLEIHTSRDHLQKAVSPDHAQKPAAARARDTSAASANGLRILLDGKPVPAMRLPAGWKLGRTIDVRIDGVPLLGSPIRIGSIRRLAGCVEVFDGGIRGWAWHPGDPDTPPALTLRDSSRRPAACFVATDEFAPVADTGPLARPRSFSLTRADLPGLAGPLHVTGPDGRDLPGSPLDPFMDEAANIAAALRLGHVYAARPSVRTRPPANGGTIANHAAGAVLRADGPVPAEPFGADGRRRAATVVIPVHGGCAVVLACLRSVLASLPAGARILVVDDGSSDPALIAALDDLVRSGDIALLRHPRAQGFPAAANAGIRAAAGRDVVLLNSDTLVPPGWLERLQQAAYASATSAPSPPCRTMPASSAIPVRPAATSSRTRRRPTGWIARHNAPTEAPSPTFRWASASAFTSGATASTRSAASAPTCSPRATARRTICACVPAAWAGATLR